MINGYQIKIKDILCRPGLNQSEPTSDVDRKTVRKERAVMAISIYHLIKQAMSMSVRVLMLLQSLMFVKKTVLYLDIFEFLSELSAFFTSLTISIGFLVVSFARISSNINQAETTGC